MSDEDHADQCGAVFVLLRTRRSDRGQVARRSETGHRR